MASGAGPPDTRSGIRVSSAGRLPVSPPPPGTISFSSIRSCELAFVTARNNLLALVSAYELNRFDGWAITEWDAQTRSERVVMSEAA